MKHNIVQYLHSATLDSATVNTATAKINSAASKSTTANSEALKHCNINSEIQDSATLFSATWRSAASNSEN